MGIINSENIKNITFKNGADICGIASVDRFTDAPKGFHPCDIFSDCKSVVVYGVHFPKSSLYAKTNSPYTFVRNLLVNKVDMITFSLSDRLEKEGFTTIPIPSSEPYDFWDAERQHGRGILSLKHAGMLSGLGKIGKNTLLINEKYGNMIWLGAVLISVDLEQDPLTYGEGCIENCSICLDSCPQNALDESGLNQKKCRVRVHSQTFGGGSVISCNICRKVCPKHEGTMHSLK